MKLKAIKKKLPVYTERLKISTLGVRDISSYAGELQQDYFVEFMDNRKILNMSMVEIKTKLASLVATYSIDYPFVYEYRLVVKDINTNELIGGLTMFPIKQTGFIEVAYWIKPKYQGRGYATEALKALSQFVLNTFKECIGVELTIQSKNTGSIKVAERCGFRLSGSINGKFDTNLVYKLWR